MKLFRYELFCEGEMQDVGFLVGIDDLGLSAEAEENLMAPFDTLLAIPEIPYLRDSVSFFTEVGKDRFRREICNVAMAYDGSIFDVVLAKLDLPEEYLGEAVYQDENQVCLPANLYQGELSGLVTRAEFSPSHAVEDSFKIVHPGIIGELYHVGTMDISRKSAYSHEGDGLSVSNCPDAWCRINKGFTHGDRFRLMKPDMKLLDYYALTDEEKRTISAWAIEKGYVEEGTLYKSISFDEGGYECYSLFKSYDEAFEEAGEEAELVQKIPWLLPTQKMLETSHVKLELLQVPDTIAALFAEQVLDYDGIYWDELLDEASYSAPRGMIFNSKLSSFQVINVTREKETKPTLSKRISAAKSKESPCQSADVPSNRQGR